MPDREKVIKEFEWQINHFSPADTSDEQFKETCKAVLELLKEQEAKQVSIAQAHFGMKYGLCPRCEKQIDTLVNPNYCGNCGQAVKWE